MIRGSAWWALKAEEYRVIAESMDNPSAKSSMEAVAEDCRRLAQQAKELEENERTNPRRMLL